MYGTIYAGAPYAAAPLVFVITAPHTILIVSQAVTTANFF
jgi:hypothetical protein